MTSFVRTWCCVPGLLACTLSGQSTWVQRTPGLPAYGSEVALVHDAQHGSFVYFIASTYWSLKPETWEWLDGVWHKQQPTRSPSGPLVAMAHDSARGCTWLVAGDASKPGFETWSWNGTDWLQAAPAASPPFAADFTLADDPARARVVLVAGTQTWVPNG